MKFLHKFLPIFSLLIFSIRVECSLPKNRLKILVYSPGISWSHTHFLGKIADTLQEAGHEVHFLKFISAPYLAERNETSKVQKVHLAYPRIKDELDGFNVQKMDSIRNAFVNGRKMLSVFFHEWDDFIPQMTKICKEVALNHELLATLSAEHFDLGISEIYDYCPFAIFHRIGVRTKLAANAIPLFQMAARHFGIPTFSSFVPNIFVSSIGGPESGFFGRLFNFYNDFYDWMVIDRNTYEPQEKFLHKIFGPNFPKLEEIMRNVSLHFVNSNPFLQSPRPISNKIVHIGGLVSSRQKKLALDKNIQQILDSASEGAILVSFGSLAESNQMPAQMRHSLLRAFGRFPGHQFIWKLDNGSQQNDSSLLAALPNVHTFEWVQQTAILGHPKMRAFITHCGWNSISEAAESGVPVLGVPLFGDQFVNALVAKHRGMGVYLDVKELNGPNAEEIMENALKRILHSPEYRQNARLIQRKLALSPFSGRENLIRWVEYAANFPNFNELNLPNEMGWFIYYSLDAILFTFAIFMAIFLLAGWICMKVARMALALMRAIKLEVSENKRLKMKEQ